MAAHRYWRCARCVLSAVAHTARSRCSDTCAVAARVEITSARLPQVRVRPARQSRTTLSRVWGAGYRQRGATPSAGRLKELGLGGGAGYFDDHHLGDAILVSWSPRQIAPGRRHATNHTRGSARVSTSPHPTRDPSPADLLLRRGLPGSHRPDGRMVPVPLVATVGDPWEPSAFWSDSSVCSSAF
jgi:hypothetical protein